MKIEFSKKEIINDDINKVNQVIKSGWLTHGKNTIQFENLISKYTGSKYCISVSSCTAGLHLSCLAAGFKKGDEVIIPAMTHVATAHAVELTGARAVLSDIDYKTGNIDLLNIKKNVSKKTKGIIIVHMAGKPCEMDKIVKFCKEKRIILIEDCAHALGTKFKKKHVGNFGITGNFSFYPTKQITTGEGGAIITNDKKLYLKLKKLKAFGIDTDINQRKNPGEYDVKFLGLNYRMTDFQAALGINQIKNYKKNLKKRHSIAKRYEKNLSKISKVDFTKFSKECSYFIFQILTTKRKILIKKFKENNIGFSIHYYVPINKMTYYKKKYKLKDKYFKNSIKYAENVISLPAYPKLKYKEIDYICKKISEIK